MTSEYGAIAHPVPGKFRTWLIEALQRHRVWLWVNLGGMAAFSAIQAIGGGVDPYSECFPSLIGTTYDLVTLLIVLLIWSGNTVILLIGLVRWRYNSLQKRLTLLALWLLTPVCWVLFVGATNVIVGPDCCNVGGTC